MNIASAFLFMLMGSIIAAFVTYTHFRTYILYLSRYSSIHVGVCV